jgi:hypothetical protein
MTATANRSRQQRLVPVESVQVDTTSGFGGDDPDAGEDGEAEARNAVEAPAQHRQIMAAPSETCAEFDARGDTGTASVAADRVAGPGNGCAYADSSG